MAEKLAKIDIEIIKKTPEATPYAGLLPFMKMCEGMGLADIINSSLNVRGLKGFKDSEYVLPIAALQICGGNTLDDLATLRQNIAVKGSPFKIPSPSAARSFMNHFHDEEEAAKQKQGQCYLPQKNEHLAGFDKIHASVFQQAYKFAPIKSITLDQDATFIYTNSKSALYNYQGKKAYEAFNTFCPEYDITVGTQLRGGNIPPGYGQFDELKRVLSTVPEGIKTVTLRSDSAGYQEEILKYCAEGENKRFGAIGFTVSCKVAEGFKQAVKALPEAVWKPMMKEVKVNGVTELQATGKECAEVNYVPDWTVKSKAEYRFIAIRERTELRKGEHPEQMNLPDMIDEIEKGNERTKRLHLTAMANLAYKVFGVVTNLTEEDVCKIVSFHHGRCGKSEEVHLILKEELGGGHVSSGKFGAEAAWWNITVLALSLLNLFKRNFLPTESHTCRPKAMRYRFFVMAGRFVRHARKTVLKIYTMSKQVIEWYYHARDRLMVFCVMVS